MISELAGLLIALAILVVLGLAGIGAELLIDFLGNAVINRNAYRDPTRFERYKHLFKECIDKMDKADPMAYDDNTHSSRYFFYMTHTETDMRSANYGQERVYRFSLNRHNYRLEVTSLTRGQSDRPISNGSSMSDLINSLARMVHNDSRPIGVEPNGPDDDFFASPFRGYDYMHGIIFAAHWRRYEKRAIKAAKEKKKALAKKTKSINSAI